MKLDTPITSLPGVGAKFAAKFKRLEIITVRDLLYHFPFRYEDWSEIVKIADLKIGEEKTIQGEIKEIEVKRAWKRRMVFVEAIIADDSGETKAVWFNQSYIKNILKPGTFANFAGKLAVNKKNEVYLSNPAYELISQSEFLPRQSASSPVSSVSSPVKSVYKHTARLIPIYPETKGLTSKGIRFLTKTIVENFEPVPDFLPEEIKTNNNLLDINTALKEIHFPENIKNAQKAAYRFAFEEIFLLQLRNLKQKLALREEMAPKLNINIDKIKSLISKLPFELTEAQKKSLWEIIQDLQKSYPMNRLLQGDVGSGKTVVAALAAIVTSSTHQTAIMAPTEILTRQHYKTFVKLFPDFAGGIALMVAKEAKIFRNGSESAIDKSALKKNIEDGNIKIVIGTHSLIQKGIKFKNLGIVIVDEQHRFGVAQRSALLRNPNNTNTSESHEKDTKPQIVERELSYKLNGILFEVHRELGRFAKERQYADLFEQKLKLVGINYKRESPIAVAERKSNFADFIIRDRVLVELKSKPYTIKTDYEQTARYLKAGNLELGLLVNFKQEYLKPKRILNSDFGTFGSNSGHSDSKIPHFLSMSATPIPRTMMIAIFGDLDVSLINELPKGRREIITKVVARENRDKAYAFIRGQVRRGRQVYVVCPRIQSQTETDNTQTKTGKNSHFSNSSSPSPAPFVLSQNQSVAFDMKAVKEEYEKLSKKVFPDLRVAMIHGKMKNEEKKTVMNTFALGQSDILVSTSVIEVGVDVPNATIMMIEGAERFGLAQLYQFRGRVGRGDKQSFCFLFSESSTKTAESRLKALINAKNGFELAEEDLKLRGPGQFLGGSQTGIPDIAMKALQDPNMIKEARIAAEKILKADQELNEYPLINERLKKLRSDIHME